MQFSVPVLGDTINRWAFIMNLIYIEYVTVDIECYGYRL